MKRFYVATYGPTTYVYDRLYLCREVERFASDADRGRSARRDAEARCEQLNRWWELELAS